MSIVGSLVGGILGSNAAGNASSALQSGAKQAQDLEKQNQLAAQNFQNDVWTGTKTAEQPYQSLGSTAAGGLQSLLSTGFQAPTLAEAEQNPGYQFQLQQGTRAIDENAAANGTLMSGNTGTALMNYGQNLAQTDYQQVYNNALQRYQANLTGLLGGSQLGLSSTGQLGQFGQAASNNMANIDLTGGEQQAQQINNAAAARASGYMGQANAWSNAIGGMTGSLSGGFGNLDSTGNSSGLEQLGNFALGALAI